MHVKCTLSFTECPYFAISFLYSFLGKHGLSEVPSLIAKLHVKKKISHNHLVLLKWRPWLYCDNNYDHTVHLLSSQKELYRSHWSYFWKLTKCSHLAQGIVTCKCMVHLSSFSAPIRCFALQSACLLITALTHAWVSPIGTLAHTSVLLGATDR